MASKRINYIVDKNNVITHWQAVPFNENMPWIVVDNPRSIHVGFDKIIDGKLVIEEKAYQKERKRIDSIMTKQSRIRQLKLELAESDYKALKFMDGALTEEEYAPIRSERQAKRDEINKLEAEIKGGK